MRGPEIGGSHRQDPDFAVHDNNLTWLSNPDDSHTLVPEGTDASARPSEDFLFHDAIQTNINSKHPSDNTARGKAPVLGV